MRLVSAIVLMMVLSFAASYFLPWWSIVFVCFFVAVMFKLSGGKGFIAGFIAVFLLWLIVALVKDHANDQILSARMAELFKLGNPYLFMTVAALTGGLVGGFAGWSGALVVKATDKVKLEN